MCANNVQIRAPDTLTSSSSSPGELPASRSQTPPALPLSSSRNTPGSHTRQSSQPLRGPLPFSQAPTKTKQKVYSSSRIRRTGQIKIREVQVIKATTATTKLMETAKFIAKWRSFLMSQSNNNGRQRQRQWRTCFIFANSRRVLSSFLRSFLLPTKIMGTLGQKCLT